VNPVGDGRAVDPLVGAIAAVGAVTKGGPEEGTPARSRSRNQTASIRSGMTVSFRSCRMIGIVRLETRCSLAGLTTS